MKLFVWVDPYRVSYGSSMLIVVADSVGAAKLLAANRCIRYAYGNCERGPNDMQKEAERLGEPDRVVDIPCAEWHEWSE